jgi:hypothetical protein
MGKAHLPTFYPSVKTRSTVLSMQVIAPYNRDSPDAFIRWYSAHEVRLKPARTECGFETLSFLGFATPLGEAQLRLVAHCLVSSICHKNIEETG